jgi:ATP-binding cassette subfamily C (CFTR/MRP) protein 1
MLKRILQARRTEELKRSKKVRWRIVWMIAASNLMETFSPALVLMTLSLQRTSVGERPLTVSQAYTVLSKLNLVANPLSHVLSSIPGMIGCVGCLGRIPRYLLHGSTKPYRHTASTSRASLTNSTSEDIATETYVAKNNIDRLCKTALLLNEASFGYSSDSMVLRNITFQANQGSMIMVVGPISSGKSTLLPGILDELYSDHGSIEVANSDMADCQQSAWLPNKTIKESIIGGADFDEDWYRTAVYACCLDVDISQVPDGENGLIGG